MSADGSWNVTMNTPMGAQKATLVLSTAGGKLTGEMKGPQGALALNDGKIDGDTLTSSARSVTHRSKARALKRARSGRKIRVGGFGNGCAAAHCAARPNQLPNSST